MNVSMIEMDPEVAQAKLDAYKESLQRKHSSEVDAEWNAALDAYKELAKGTPLLDPVAAIRNAGWRADGRPVLAIARADQKRVTFSFDTHGRRWNAEKREWFRPWNPMSWTFVAAKARWDRQRAASLRFNVPDVTEQPPVDPKNGAAMVPMVPADVMPARGCDLSKHFILWEVESWDFAPPVDPILLRPIGGNLYAVVAQWDLTEVERLIIAGTRGDK